jgi:hypothetical protein
LQKRSLVKIPKATICRMRDDWFPGVYDNCSECRKRIAVAGAMADARRRGGRPSILYYCDDCGPRKMEQALAEAISG